MLRSDFNYELPEELIAQDPPAERGVGRLLCLDKENSRFSDRLFSDLMSLVKPGDLLVFNDTRVIPARLFGNKDTGGKVEILVERLLEDSRMLAQIRASKTPKIGTMIFLDEDVSLVVSGRDGEFFILEVPDHSDPMDLLEHYGHVPLPPYIKRQDEETDKERYQTIFARHPGAVAAPTAGLHFSDDMMSKLINKGCHIDYVTLHVGAGTFQPVRTEEIETHKMHHERFSISESLCQSIKTTRENKGRVIAVGTTVVRTLESAARAGNIEPQVGETDIFIYPGFEFRIIDALITNFHLPESTLLMLVCAFAGRELVLQAYQHAIKEKYQFFSYGDAMFIS